MPDATNPPLFPFRSVVLGAFVPAFLFDVGVGAPLPVIAPTATDLGSSLASVVALTIAYGDTTAEQRRKWSPRDRADVSRQHRRLLGTRRHLKHLAPPLA